MAIDIVSNTGNANQDDHIESMEDTTELRGFIDLVAKPHSDPS